MILSYAMRGAATSRRVREYMRRTGLTPWGDIMWTKEEDAILKTLHPNYKAIKKALRRRTMPAIRARARKLGLTKKIHIWKGTELMKLRRLYTSNAPRAEILAALPGITWGQIDNCAQYHRLYRSRKPFKKTGHAALDSVRQYAFEHNISMPELDKMARTKKYFQVGRWVCSGTVSEKAIAKAVKALGGVNIPYFPGWSEEQRKTV